MSTEFTPPLWHGVYAPVGQCGIHVDVMEERGNELRIVGPTLAAQWVPRADVVPSIEFKQGGVARVGKEAGPPDPNAYRQLPFFPFTWGQ